MLVATLLLFIFLLALGFPIYVALATPAIIYLHVAGFPLSTAAYAAYQSLSSFPLVAAPLFILMGAMANEFGETERLFRFVRVLVKGRPGYSAKVNVFVSLVFSGVSGSAIADMGSLSQVQARAMVREGFSKVYAGALSGATAVVGPIFPPSIPLIIFAASAQVSTLDALLAGVAPALIIVACLYVFVSWQTTQKLKYSPPSELNAAVGEEVSLLRAFVDAIPALLVAPILVGSMLSGILSPSEAGAFAVLYLCVVQIARGHLSIWRYVSCVSVSFKISSSIFVVIGSAAIFNRVLVLERFPQIVSSTLLSVSDNPIVVLLLINLLVLLVGMFMETISALVILTPILLVVASGIGMDPVHLGVILVFNLTIGLVTPPMGVGVYIISSAIKERPEAIFREMIPLYIPLFAALLLITFIPQISLLFR